MTLSVEETMACEGHSGIKDLVSYIVSCIALNWISGYYRVVISMRGAALVHV